MLKKSVQYIKNLPSARSFSKTTILLYDDKTLQHPFIKSWVETFKYRIALNAGESLKTLDSYSFVLKQVQNMVRSNELGGSDLNFVALGGGTVGDFVGFLASTYQRGRKLVLIPTTWLAAIDSAHGGKNGLNLDSVKNQIGTIYPAEKIYICEKVLKTLPQSELNNAFAEALKICLINQPKKFFKIEKDSRSLYQHLPYLIAGKYNIVEKDLYEKKGLRKVLNLGHTMGHVFEAIHNLSHGQAVFFGILFSLRFSLRKKYIKWSEFQRIIEKLFVIEANLTYQQAIQIPGQKVREVILQDKKKVNQGIDFIFIKSLGKVVVKTVKVNEIVTEVLRQQREL